MHELFHHHYTRKNTKRINVLHIAFEKKLIFFSFKLFCWNQNQFLFDYLSVSCIIWNQVKVFLKMKITDFRKLQEEGGCAGWCMGWWVLDQVHYHRLRFTSHVGPDLQFIASTASCQEPCCIKWWVQNLKLQNMILYSVIQKLRVELTK